VKFAKMSIRLVRKHKQIDVVER